MTAPESTVSLFYDAESKRICSAAASELTKLHHTVMTRSNGRLRQRGHYRMAKSNERDLARVVA
jgi:hypothetical protein